MPEATNTPTAPSSMLFLTSFVVLTPAPTIKGMSPAFFTLSLITAGFEVETETSPPISSGGS